MKAETKMRCKVGKYTCRCTYKIVGLTDSTKEDFNRLLAKEECKNVEKC